MCSSLPAVLCDVRTLVMRRRCRSHSGNSAPNCTRRDSRHSFFGCVGFRLPQQPKPRAPNRKSVALLFQVCVAERASQRAVKANMQAYRARVMHMDSADGSNKCPCFRRAEGRESRRRLKRRPEQPAAGSYDRRRGGIVFAHKRVFKAREERGLVSLSLGSWLPAVWGQLCVSTSHLNMS